MSHIFERYERRGIVVRLRFTPCFSCNEMIKLKRRPGRDGVSYHWGGAYASDLQKLDFQTTRVSRVMQPRRVSREREPSSKAARMLSWSEY